MEAELSLVVGDDDIGVLVSFTWDTYTPAKTSALPEDCYPSDGGLQKVISVEVNGIDILSILDGEVFQDIENRLESYISEYITIEEYSD